MRLSTLLRGSLVNLSVSNGYVPQHWKTAKITPIYKGEGTTNEGGNFRPVSIIPTITKIIEAFIKSQLMLLFDIPRIS